VRMSGEVQGVFRRGRVIGNFCGVHERNAKSFRRLSQGAQCVRREEPMHVIEAGHDDALAFPWEGRRLPVALVAVVWATRRESSGRLVQTRGPGRQDYVQHG
jgi:hypothetical protein